MWLFITELVTAVPNWPQPKHASPGGGINKLWYIHTMENHLAVKEKKHRCMLQRDESQMHFANVKHQRLNRVVPFIQNSRENRTLLAESNLRSPGARKRKGDAV